jgi:hypothetical protein
MFSAFYCKSSAEAKPEEIQSTPQAQILLPGGVKGQGSESCTGRVLRTRPAIPSRRFM